MRSSISNRAALAALLILALPAAAWAQGTGLYGEYYNNADFTGAKATKLEGPINVVWVATTIPVVAPPYPPLPVTALPAAITPNTTFSVRWRGRIDLPLAGDWLFRLRGDDGVRLYVDGVLRINGWRDQGLTSNYTATITGMTLGKHDIMIEYYNSTGDAGIIFSWDPPGAGLEEVVPVTALYATVDTTTTPGVPAPVIGAPVVSAPGTIPNQTVTISVPGTPPAGTAVYYTTDGSDPGATSPLGTATLYAGPFQVTDYAQVVARAYVQPNDDTVPSDQGTMTFSPTYAGVAAPDAVSGNVYFRYYHPGGGLNSLPNFDALTPRQRGLSTQVDELPPKEQTNDYGFVFTGYLQVGANQGGTFTFYLNSTTGSKLTVQNKVVVNNDGLRSIDQERSGLITLQPGLHPIRVDFWRRDQGANNLEFRWENTGATAPIAKAIVPAASLWTEPLTAAPSISPNGGVINGTQDVTISSTAGSIIYYTTDGTYPTNALATGTGASPLLITLTAAATVRAVAYAPQRNISPITTSAAFTITAPPTAPAIQTVVASTTTNEIVVAFDRPIGTGADVPGNYALTNGVTPLNVTGATLIPKTGVLLGHWPLQIANTGNDATGNNATPLTLTNATTAADVPPALGGATDGSLAFNGTDSQATAPHDPYVNVAAGSFTVAFWFKTNDLAVRQRLISKYQGITNAPPTANTDPTGGWNIDLSTGLNDAVDAGKIRFHIKAPRSGDRQDSVFTPSPALVAGTWYHLAARVDRRTNQLAVFLNGVQVGGTVSFFTPGTSLSDMALPATNPLLGLGVIPSNPGFFFNGNMDDVRLYRISLSNQEIAELAAGRSDLTRAVRLTTDTLVGGTDYSLTVTGVQDKLGNPIAAGATRKFRYLATGTMNREVFGFPVPPAPATIGGNQIADMTRNSAFPNSPGSGSSLTDITFGTVGDNYGTRVRGYFIPTSTDDWIFSVSGDDGTQLWISPNEDPSSSYLVSRVNGSTGAGSYATASTATGSVLYQSGPSTGTQTNLGITIPMVVNQKYFFEILQKEGGGGDHLSASARAAAGAPVAIANLAAAIDTTLITGFAESVLFTTPPASRAVSTGSSVTFTATITGTAPRTYEWLKDGSVIPGAISSSYTIPVASTLDNGGYSVRVTNPAGVATSPEGELVVSDLAAVPTIGSIDPTGGPTAGLNTVTINGGNFVPGQTTVTFGGVSAMAGSVNVTGGGAVLTCVAPPRPANTYTVVVSTPGGYATTSYTYVSGPTIGGINPAHGPIAGTQPVTISGTGFLAGQTSVTINGQLISPANVNVLSQISLTCTRPAGTIQDAVDVVVTTPGGSATLTDGYNYWSPPTLGSTLPTGGVIGGLNTITLSGNNFVAGVGLTTVTIGGVTAGTPNVLNLTTLTCVVNPQGPPAAGAFPVVVTTPGGVSAQVVNYTFYNAPTFTGMTPVDGPDDGGTVVTLTGTNFVVGQTNATFGGAGTVPVTTPDAGVTWNATAPVGTAFVGPVNVTVTTPGGTTAPRTFTYHANPTASLVSPNDGPNGGGTLVTITGANFATGAGLTTVTFGTNAPVAATTVAGDGSSLTVSTPNNLGPAGVALGVVVNTPGGSTAPVANAFTYHLAPSITNFTPAFGPASGLTVVTINGANFPALKTSVTFDGQAAGNVIASGASLTCETPQHTPAFVTIRVTTPGGFIDSATTYEYRGPFINTISPTSGLAGGGQPVTLTGINLNPVPGSTTVTFNGGPPVTINNINGTQIQVTSPAGTAGTTVPVVVTTPDGSHSINFSYVNPPAVSGVTPNQGPVGGNQSVTITGTGFVNGSTTVTVGGNNATVNTVSPTQITITTPQATALAAGQVNVVVTTFGTAASPVVPAASYTYVAVPTVATITPSRGSTNGGQDVTITGTNFVSGIGLTAVTFDGASATFVNVVDSSTLTCRTPAGAAGPADVVVTTFPGTGSQASAPNASYTYINHATAIDLEVTMFVNNGAAGVGQDVIFTITLDNFGAAAGSGVTVTDLLPAALSYKSHTVTVGSYTPGTGIWNVGNIAANNGTAVLTLTATVNSAVSSVNTAEVTAAGQEDLDSVPNNGVTTEDDLDTASVASGLVIQTAAALPAGTAGAYYRVTLAASGGNAPYTWSLVSSTPAFPFNLDPATGVISGFAPDVAANYTFTIQAADAAATPEVSSKAFTLAINAATGGAPVIGTSTPAPNGVVGQAYTYAFTATGGAPPYTWSVSTGTLPAGLSLNPFTGVLAGTPTGTTAANFQVTATSATTGASAPLVVNFTIATNPLTITPLTVPNGTVQAAYTHYLDVSGGVGPFTWSTTGTLPPNVTLSSGTGRRATLTGTPLAATAGANFTVQVADNGQAAVNASRAYSVVIAVAGGPIVITTAGLPVGTQDTPYSAMLSARGGTPAPNYFWSLVAGSSLPPGLLLNGSGLIGNGSSGPGTPTAAGVYTFTVQAAQFGGGVTPATADITITIAPQPTLTGSLTLPAAVQGQGYFAQLTFAGGAQPVTWTGTPPAGLTLNPVTGTIQGTPTAAGSPSFTLTATDANGSTAAGSFTMTIAPPPGALAVISTTLPRGQVGVPYSANLFATGGTPPYNPWAIFTGGALPAGLSLNAVTGAITGTPTVPTVPAGNPYTFRVTDGAAATSPASATINLAIDGALTITTTTLPLAGVTSPYAALLAASGGSVPYVWTLSSGSLPGGLSLSPSGLITGTCSAAAVTSNFQARVTDSQGRTASRSYTITVGPALPSGGGGGGGGGGGCGGSIGLSSMPLGALASLAGLLALATRRRRRI